MTEAAAREAAAGRRRWVALVTGPLQLISAVEAFHRFDGAGTIHYYARERPAAPLADLCRRAGIGLRWARRGTPAERTIGLLALAAAALAAGRVMLGSLHQRPFLLAAVLARRRLVLLDDGSLTEATTARRAAGVPARSWLGRRLDARPLVVFSIYSPAMKAGDELVRNRLAHLRSLYPGPLRPVDEAWVAGQPFVELGMMSRERYRDLVAPFVRRMRGESLEVLYVPHPRESEAAAAEACGDLGVPQRRLDGPIELEVLASGRAPRAVFSISSTLLDTLPLLREESLPALTLWSAPVDAAALGTTPPSLLGRLRALQARGDLRVA
jgi:hypothetical protein